jgi:hypothetical protein
LKPDLGGSVAATRLALASFTLKDMYEIVPMLRNGIRVLLLNEKHSGRYVLKNWFHARLAAAALVKMAKTASDSEMAANLLRVAANLKDQAGGLPISGIGPPDVQSELRNDIRPPDRIATPLGC